MMKLEHLALFVFLTSYIQTSSSYYFGQMLHAVTQLLDFNGVCKYNCDNGAIPIADPNEKPHLNGCGSYGFTFDTSDWPGFKSCCDNHDACYDTCLTEKETCDQQFKQCLKGVCNVLIEYAAEQFGPQVRNDSISKVDKDVDKAKQTHTANDEAAKSCFPLARIMVGVVETIGCGAYQRGQRRVCTCDHGNRKETDSMYEDKKNVTLV